MSATLLKALLALLPTSVLFSGSAVLFYRERTVCSLVQLLGAGSLVVMVLTHIFEALRLFPAMQWGLRHSAGHYLDLWSAVLGLTLLPTGYLLRRIVNPK